MTRLGKCATGRRGSRTERQAKERAENKVRRLRMAAAALGHPPSAIFRPYEHPKPVVRRFPRSLIWNEPQRQRSAPRLLHVCSDACRPRNHA